jgi:hypothetical protein
LGVELSYATSIHILAPPPYTKQLNDGGYPELVWYIGVYKNDIDSSDDTDSEDIALQSL